MLCTSITPSNCTCSTVSDCKAKPSTLSNDGMSVAIRNTRLACVSFGTVRSKGKIKERLFAECSPLIDTPPQNEGSRFAGHLHTVFMRKIGSGPPNDMTLICSDLPALSGCRHDGQNKQTTC